MLTNFSSLEGALIGLAVLVFFVVRQFSTRPVLSLWGIGLPLVLAYLGIQGLLSLDQTGWLLLGVNLSLGAALGFARGTSVRLWVDEHGQALMRGTALTMLLWVATVGVKVLLSIVERQMGLGALSTSNTEIMLPAAVTIAVQVLVMYLRSRDLAAVATA
jgi:hypothetical protein